MNKNIFYDHAFTLDKNHKFLSRLEKMGFKMHPGMVEHPGKAFCRFIMFKENENAKPKYLEFVDVRQPKPTYRVPGLSFRYKKDLLSFSKSLDKSKLTKTKYGHKNYEWKTNSKDHLPGWNFMSFKNLPLKSYYPWFTEYEPYPKRKPLKPIKAHPNSAYGIYGVEISINSKASQFYSKLFGEKINDQVTLGDKTKVLFKKGSKNQFHSVIIKVRSLKKLERFAAKAKFQILKTPRGLKILNPHPSPLMYELEFIEIP